MLARKFALTLPYKRKAVLFPLPQTHHYQVITQLVLPDEVEKLTLNPTTEVAIFPQLWEDDLIFSQKPIAIQKKLSEVKIKQTSGFSFATDQYIDPTNKEMKKLAIQWLSRRKIKTPNDILKVLYEKTLEFLEYGNPTRGLYTYQEALQTRVTDCGGFSTFLATLLQTQSIPCRLVVGYLYKLGTSYTLKDSLNFPKHFADISMHAWLEVEETDGSWFPVDPAIDWKRRHNQTHRAAGFGMIPADRLVVSFGQNYHLSYRGKEYNFPILQHPEILE